VSTEGKVKMKDKGVKGKGDNCFALNLLADLRLVQDSTLTLDVILSTHYRQSIITVLFWNK
jgi:hypothetical protein